MRNWICSLSFGFTSGANIHNICHVSMLHRYILDPRHVLTYKPLDVREDLTYVEQPVQILDRRDHVLITKVIPLVKVLWRNHVVEKATWERKEEMHIKYPYLFDT